jgi:GMP synthase-like glutamine amidotransferase
MTTSTIHVLQHHALEGPGHIAHWAKSRGISLEFILPNQPLPNASGVQSLILLGGMHSVNDPHNARIRDELDFVRQLAALPNRAVFGICLGAQILASVFGAKVQRMPAAELGWHVLRTSPGSPMASLLAAEVNVYQWHDEQFSLPPGFIEIGATNQCKVQGFVSAPNKNTAFMGVQCHPEWDAQMVRRLINAEESQVKPALPDSDDIRWQKNSTLTSALLDFWWSARTSPLSST